jgi:uncharacterized protein YrrD
MATKVQFQKDATVLASNGQEVGSIERVVLSPESKLVTHIVVRKGALLNRMDKVVPIDLIAEMTEDRIILSDEAGDLESFPPFEEEHVVDKKIGLDQPPIFDSSSPELIGYPEPNIPVIPDPGEQYVTQIGQNIPEGTVALKEGAKVITADGQQVGKVERVLADLSADEVTHLLVSRGMFPKETKLIPMEWVTTMTDEEVYLGVEEDTVKELADVSITR